MSKYSRRDFLKTGSIAAGAALTPHQALAGTIINSLFRQSFAEAANLVSPRYYVNLSMGGGPPRYNFDHWLRPSASDPVVTPAAYAATALKYNSNREWTGWEYKTFDYNGSQVPHIFSTFGTSAEQAFLDSFLVIQGYGSGVDSHGVNALLQQHPLAAAPSISGLLADNTDRFFEAIQYPPRGNSGRFVSKKNIGLNVLSNTPLAQLLAPLSTAGTSAGLRSAQQDLFSNLRSFLNSLGSNSKAMQIARSSIANSYKLLQKTEFNDYAAEYTAAETAYQTAIDQAVQQTYISGINATPAGERIAITSDGASLFRRETFYIAQGKNISEMGQNGTIRQLAASLALAEYCIKNDLVTVFELTAGMIEGLRNDSSSTETFRQGNDCHGTGGMIAFSAFSLFYRGIIAALLLFKQRLQAAGKWNNTIVHLTSEFDRVVSPGGSGHGTQQMVASVFSGAINGGPYVVGNISNKVPRGGEGPQGIAMPIDGYNMKGLPSAIMMASTLSELMAVPSNPWQNFGQPLVKMQPNGTLLYPFGKGKVIVE